MSVSETTVPGVAGGTGVLLESDNANDSLEVVRTYPPKMGTRGGNR